MIEFEVPTYESLLAQEAPLSSRAQSLQYLLQGTIVPTPAWIEAHPDLADEIFDELLSDAVLSRAAQEPGLVQDPDVFLAPLAADETSRRGTLYTRYRRWLAGSYRWQAASDHRLERELASLIDNIESDWQATLHQLPRMGESHVIRLYSWITIREGDTEAFSPPELMQHWQALILQLRNQPEDALPQLFASLRFARDLPYPALEIRLLDLLEDVLAESGQTGQGLDALQRAQQLAQAQGFAGLAAEIGLGKSLYDNALLPALEAFRVQIDGVEDPDIRDRLKLRLAIILVRQHYFEAAGQELQALTKNLSSPLAERVLALGVAIAYPFAWERVLAGLSSRRPDEVRSALNALSYLSEPETGPSSDAQPDEDESQSTSARRDFYRGLNHALARLLRDPDPELQQGVLTSYSTLAKIQGVSQPEPADLLALLKTAHPALRTAVIRALYAQESSLPAEVRQELLPLLIPTDGDDGYFLLKLIKPLKGPEVVPALELFLQHPETPAWLWSEAWQQLQMLDPARARQSLSTACEQREPESAASCLTGWLGLEGPDMPEHLIRLLTSRSFVAEDFNRVGASLPAAHLPRLLGLLKETDTQVLHGVMASLRSAQRFDPESLSDQYQRQLQTALTPLLGHTDAQIRLQASELYLLQHNDQARALLPQLLASEQAADFLLALTVLHRWHPTEQDPAPDLPAVPLDRLSGWLAQPEQSLAEPLAWTQVSGVDSESKRPLSLYSGLAHLLSQSWFNPPQLSEAQLLQLLEHPEPALRVYAIERLGWQGDPHHAGVLQSLLRAQEPQVRFAAYGSLLKIRKGMASYYLEELQHADDLPEETDQRIRFILQDAEAGEALMQQTQYEHLRTRPAYREALWERLSAEDNPELLFQIVSQLSEGTERPALERIKPLLEASQTSLRRTAGLRLLLNQAPPFPAVDPLWEALESDADVVLPLGLLWHWLSSQDYPRARSLMKRLVSRAEIQPDRIRLGLVWALYPEELRRGSKVKDLVQMLLEEDLLAFDPDESKLSDWLIWIADRDLPLGWRLEILIQIADSGNTPDLLPLLDILSQDPALGQAARAAQKAIRERLPEP